MQKLLFIFLLFTGCYTVCAQGDEAHQFPQMEDQWLRAAPPNAMMLAAYGQLTNNTHTDAILIGAYSPAFQIAEIHKTTITNGVASMAQQHQLMIKAGEKLQFQPGGLHIMLMQPKQKILAGEKIKICLIYQQDDKEFVQHIMFPVEKR
jgi:copper(I)-binding protein